MSFIRKYFEHSKEYESPSSFWKWSAYGAISAVLRDNCYRKQGDDYLFANIYTLLLADSAIHRKGRPVRLAESIMAKVNNTKIISGRASIQAILDELSHTETDQKTGRITKGGSAIFVAEELAAGLVADPESIAIMTNIYDYKPDFVSRLRTQGKFRIDRLVFSMLAASNEDLLRGFYDNTAIKGGLLGRTFIILPNEFRESNSLFQVSDKSESHKELVKSLSEISLLHGEFVVEPDAIREYESWYSPFRMSYKNKVDKSGVVGRLHTGVLKIAFILAANEVSLNVKRCHMEEAITECLALIPNYRSFIMTSGRSNISETGAIVLEELLSAKDRKLSRKLLLREHWSNFDAELLDKAMVTLEQAGLVTTVVEGSEVSYQMTQKCVEIMKGNG